MPFVPEDKSSEYCLREYICDVRQSMLKACLFISTFEKGKTHSFQLGRGLVEFFHFFQLALLTFVVLLMLITNQQTHTTSNYLQFLIATLHLRLHVVKHGTKPEKNITKNRQRRYLVCITYAYIQACMP